MVLVWTPAGSSDHLLVPFDGRLGCGRLRERCDVGEERLHPSVPGVPNLPCLRIVGDEADVHQFREMDVMQLLP